MSAEFVNRVQNNQAGLTSQTRRGRVHNIDYIRNASLSCRNGTP